MWKISISLLISIGLFNPLNANAFCNINSSFLNLGIYNPIDDTDTLSTGSIEVICEVQQQVQVNLSAGSSANFSERRMNNAVNSDYIAYNIYTDVTRFYVFGDGTGGSSSYSGSATNHIIHLFGKIPKQQPIRPGSYSDAITITMDF